MYVAYLEISLQLRGGEAFAAVPIAQTTCVPNTCPFEIAPNSFGVSCSTPLPCATNVPTAAPVLIEFNRPIRLPGLGLITFTDNDAINDVTTSLSADGLTLIITPTSTLSANTSFLAILAEVFEQDGTHHAGVGEFCFSTGPILNCPTPPVCQSVNATDGAVPLMSDFTYQPPFAANSIWNTPIDASAEIDANSATMIAAFAAVANAQGGIALSYQNSGVPVYIADANTPNVNVELLDTNTPLVGVPISPGAIVECGFDRLMGVLDPQTNRFYEFWNTEQLNDGSWRAETGDVIEVNGSGIFPGNGSVASGVRASGFSLLAGMIWPQELQAGAINHALAFYYFPTRSGGPVLPATASDGTVDDPAALPIGAHLQLDPNLDLNTLNLQPWERTIAEALQTYGMYCADTGSGIALSMLHGYSFQGDPYSGLLPPEAYSGWSFLSKLPAQSFRVLKPPSAPTATPAVSAWGIGIMMLLILAAGILILKSRAHFAVNRRSRAE